MLDLGYGWIWYDLLLKHLRIKGCQNVPGFDAVAKGEKAASCLPRIAKLAEGREKHLWEKNESGFFLWFSSSSRNSYGLGTASCLNNANLTVKHWMLSTSLVPCESLAFCLNLTSHESHNLCLKKEAFERRFANLRYLMWTNGPP